MGCLMVLKSMGKGDLGGKKWRTERKHWQNAFEFHFDCGNWVGEQLQTTVRITTLPFGTVISYSKEHCVSLFSRSYIIIKGKRGKKQSWTWSVINSVLENAPLFQTAPCFWKENLKPGASRVTACRHPCTWMAKWLRCVPRQGMKSQSGAIGGHAPSATATSLQPGVFCSPADCS